MDRRRLALTALFSLLFFALLPLSVWVMNAFGFPWLFLLVLGLMFAGYALLWPYRLVFLLLLLALSGSGLLYRHGDLLFSLLFFMVPYGVACVAIAYRIAERLSPVEWVEPSYPEEPGDYEGYGEGARPGWNPYADSRPMLLRRGKPVVEEVESREAQREEDPCGGDRVLDLLLKRDADDPEAERLLHEYMECRARWLIEHFDEYERGTSLRVEEK